MMHAPNNDETTRAGNYPGSLCLSSGVFARYLQMCLRNLDDLPANGQLAIQRTKARQIDYFFVVGLNPIGWEGLRACGTLIDNAAIAW